MNIDYTSIRFRTLALFVLVVLMTSISTQAGVKITPYELCPDAERKRPPACVTVQESETRISATSACTKRVIVTSDVLSRKATVQTREQSIHIFLNRGDTETLMLTDVVSSDDIADKRLEFTRVQCCRDYLDNNSNPGQFETCE